MTLFWAEWQGDFLRALFLWADHRWRCHSGLKLHKKRQWGLPFCFLFKSPDLAKTLLSDSCVAVAPDRIWKRSALNISQVWWSGGPHWSLWCQWQIMFEHDGKNQTAGVHPQTLWNVGARKGSPPWTAGLGWMESKGLLTALRPFLLRYKSFWGAAGLWTQPWVQWPHRPEDLPNHHRSSWWQSFLGWGPRCPSLTPSCLAAYHL